MIPSLDKDKIAELEYDIVIVGGVNVSMPAVLKDAKQLGLDEDKIVLDRTVCVPGFTLEKYRRLRQSKLTILAQQCSGGYFYNTFGLPFLSPTINMGMTSESFSKLIHDPMNYMNKELRFYTTGFDPNLKIKHPIFLLGDVILNMNHYPDTDQARAKWEKRRLKINWFNVLVISHTTDPNVLADFDRLPYAKKACFVSFPTTLNSGFYLSPEIVRGRFLGEPLNEIAGNIIHPYDLWDLLLYGKKTPINQ